ncbi:hypothetical protein H5T51_08470 [Candidatus Bathyarchaeota archaeon]|nr:hypothetical protein [Candidatus Bathyarchaeota archaeon]
MEAWLDVSILRCPACGSYYAEASWYVVEMESDIQCGNCGMELNSKKNMTDRVLIRFELNDFGRVKTVNIEKHIER